VEDAGVGGDGTGEGEASGGRVEVEEVGGVGAGEDGGVQGPSPGL